MTEPTNRLKNRKQPIDCPDDTLMPACREEEREIKASDVILCKISIRPEYEGRLMLPQFAELNGTVLEMKALWLMDEDDKYPGEWALWPADKKILNEWLDKYDKAWIASGDVEMQEEFVRGGLLRNAYPIPKPARNNSLTRQPDPRHGINHRRIDFVSVQGGQRHD
jgi:hypothetical protein